MSSKGKPAPLRTHACWGLRDGRPIRILFGAVTLRIVVAEDSLLVREGIARLLSSAPDLELVASCGDYDALVTSVEEDDPDVVLTDIKMPPTSTDEGIRLATRLRTSHPQVGVVVLSQYSEPGYVLALFESGSDRRAYLLKERLHDRATLLSAIRSVAGGGSSVDPKIIDVLVSGRTGVASSPLAELTPREREVLAEIAKGKSNAAIAQALFLTKRAVEKHINSIFLKLGLDSAEDISKRVKAALMFLADVHGDPADQSSRP
jgi:DNA-binding NarL/FixJ family response regulator